MTGHRVAHRGHGDHIALALMGAFAMLMHHILSETIPQGTLAKQDEP
jgi:hypothetical protein